MIKWIGGATGALALVFGTATLAGNWMDSSAAAPAPSLAAAIPLDEPWSDLTIPVDANAIGANAVIDAALADDNGPDNAPGLRPAVATGSDTATLQRVRDERFVIKRILPITGPIKYGEWHWDDEGVPPGPIVMTVDLEARVISVFRGGYEIGAAAVLLGSQDHPTPLGTFPILTKEKDNVSEKYNNAPMPYTLRLTWSGVAIHGSEVENGYASHGCVGTPTPFAAKLFAVAKKGDKVIITRGQNIGMGDAIL